MTAHARTVLIRPAPAPAGPSTPERRLLGLLARGQTPAQAAEALRLPPDEAEAMEADLLRRLGLPGRRRLLVRALLHGWL